MKCKLFILTIIAILFFTQCENKKKLDIDWKTYHNEMFMIDYPANWDVDTTGQFNVQAFGSFSPETGDKTKTLSFGITLIIDSTDLKTAVDNFMSQWLQNENAKISKTKSMDVGRHKALHVEAIVDKIQFKNYFLKKDNTLIYLFLAGHGTAFKLWGETGEDMINSFRIIN